MANTITLLASLVVQSDTLAVQASVSKSNIPQAEGKLAVGKVQNITADQPGEALEFGFASVGYVFVKNLDTSTEANHWVELGLAQVTGPALDEIFAKLRPGEGCLVPVYQDALYARANTAAVDVLVCAAQI
jgi:hypothetical protein